MDCPRCAAPMRDETFDGHLAKPVAIDVCFACQSFWFDARESLALTPTATLALFTLIGEHVGKPQPASTSVLECPRCKGRLKPTRDMQRSTRFEYLRCPNNHGRLTTFFEFLKEKDFVRPLTPQQVAELRQHVQMVNCSNCGAPVDLAAGSACAHCASPLSMLDMTQAERLVDQLRRADRSGRPVDPALPLDLARARREVDAAFKGYERDPLWFDDVSSNGLVGAGLQALAKWLSRQRH